MEYRKGGVNIKPLKKTKLLKPLISVVELTDPDWIEENRISFYVPVALNPDEYFKRIKVNNADTDDYINIYLTYAFVADKIELGIIYINNSGYKENFDDFEIKVKLDRRTKTYLRGLIDDFKQENADNDIFDFA